MKQLLKQRTMTSVQWTVGTALWIQLYAPLSFFRSLKRPYLSFGIFQYAPYKSHYIFILLYNFYNISECFLLYLKLPFLWTLWKWSCTALARKLVWDDEHKTDCGVNFLLSLRGHTRQIHQFHHTKRHWLNSSDTIYIHDIHSNGFNNSALL